MIHYRQDGWKGADKAVFKRKVYDKLFVLTEGRSLKGKNCVLIFDEVQLFPQARQAIKYLVADGRYEYIETGSLISIRKKYKRHIQRI